MPSEDPWEKLRLATRARIGLGRAGDAMKIADVIDFQFAHANIFESMALEHSVFPMRVRFQPRSLRMPSGSTARSSSPRQRR